MSTKFSERRNPAASPQKRRASRANAAKGASAGGLARQAQAAAATPPEARSANHHARNYAVQELARRELARRRLLQFTRRVQKNYKPGWVHEDICARLERFSADVAAQRSPRLMLLIPPRHGKSTLASITFPAWHLGHHPDHEIVDAGYNLDLPMKFSRQVRDILRARHYHSVFPDTKLSEESQSVESWLTTAGGGYTAVGVGGGLTGKGAHILIVDDPIKNMEEADSIDTRDKLWDWYQSVAYTRLAPGGGVLVIETWWNDDDLAGRLQQVMASGDAYADKFDIVRYPALAEAYEFKNTETLEITRVPAAQVLSEEDLVPTPPQILLRRPEEALHVERYDAEALKRMRGNMQPRIWSALYQQSPAPEEGAYFKRENLRFTPSVPSPGRGVYAFSAWDFAIGEKQTSDWTVGVTGLLDHTDNLYIVDVVRFKDADSARIVDEILEMAIRWGVLARTPYVVGFEDGQIWRAMRPLFKKRCAERSVYPSYEELKPLTDKLARARALQGRMQQGRVLLKEGMPWEKPVTSELLRFPAGAHDDIVDALAWLANVVVGKAPPQAPRERRLPSWKDKLKTSSSEDVSHMAA